jgi:DNA-binding transcriptional MerR regulator
MRMKELSEASGVPVATIKFYLRERLLPAGRRTHPNQSLYGEAHLRRIRLIRALIEVGGLSVAGARGVIAVLDLPTQSVHNVLGLAQHAMTPAVSPPDTQQFRAARDRVDETLVRLGWRVSPESAGRDGAALVLSTMAELHQDRLTDVLEPYARAAQTAAAADLDAVGAAGVDGDRDAMVETAVIGMVVGEALLLHLRRMAQEHLSAQRLSRTPRNGTAPSSPGIAEDRSAP